MSTTRTARDRLGDEPTRNQSTVAYELANSTVVLETGPAGALARIERAESVEYAGPLPEETVSAIKEVAQ